MGEDKQFMCRCSRSSFFFVIVVVGLLSPVTGLDDPLAAAIALDSLATVSEPDVDPACPKDYPTPLNADSPLPLRGASSSPLVRLGLVLSFLGQGESQCLGHSFRIPRAPPAS